MSQSRYAAYKDSGVAWLGQVPAHWEVVPSKSLFKERNEKVRIDDKQLTASQEYGIIKQEDFALIEGRSVMQVILNPDILKHVEPRDFVISMRSFQGGLEYSTISGCISSAYVILSPRFNNIFDLYFKYLFKCVKYIQGLQTTTNLVRDGQALRYYNFSILPLPLPPLAEQQAIAAFLDRECARIDALVAAQQRMIALLKEKRQAQISHAVTHGLDPAAPRKDSGVAWLGQVPAHWQVKKIKNKLAIPITDGPHETPEFVDEGVMFISAESVSSGKIDFSKIRGFISPELNKIYSIKYQPKLFDIYMVKSGATTGITAICDERTDFNIWSPLAALRCGDSLFPYFLLYYLRSTSFQDAVRLFWTFGTQQNIGMNVIANLNVLIPPLAEQQAIAAFLDRECARIDTLIGKAEQAIALLHERRSALIAAAVTGQIRVANEE
jgi:type I restriction enzyme S subunit